MTSRLTKNIFSSVGQTVIQIVVLIILYRYLIEQLGVKRLGIWSLVMATASAARISELGLGGSITKFVATYRAQENEKAAADSLQTAAITIGIFFGLVILAAYPALQLVFPHIIPREGLDEGLLILPFGLASFWLTSVASIWMNGLDACLRTDLRALIMILGTILYFLFSLIGVTYYGLVGLVTAQLLQGIFLAIVGWLVLPKVMNALPLLPIKWKFARFWEMLSYGVNFQVNSIVMMLFEPTTKILLGRYGGLAAVGYFEMAQKMVSKVRTLVVAGNQVIVPVYAGMASYNIEAPYLYAKNMSRLLFIIIPLFSVLLALSPAISEVWIGTFQEQFVVMSVGITLAWFLNSFNIPSYFAYLGQGKLRWVTIAHVTMGAINIILGLLLGRLFNWQGVITAFIISLMVGSLLPLITYHYENGIKLIHILSVYDIVMAGICFTMALIILTGYWIFIDVDLMSKWSRVVLATGGMGIITLTALWFNPLRQELYAQVINKIGYLQKT